MRIHLLDYVIERQRDLYEAKNTRIMRGPDCQTDFFLLRLTHPTPGIEPGRWMRCAISGMSSVSATLDTHPR